MTNDDSMAHLQCNSGSQLIDKVDLTRPMTVLIWELSSELYFPERELQFKFEFDKKLNCNFNRIRISSHLISSIMSTKMSNDLNITRPTSRVIKTPGGGSTFSIGY